MSRFRARYIVRKKYTNTKTETETGYGLTPSEVNFFNIMFEKWPVRKIEPEGKEAKSKRYSNYKKIKRDRKKDIYKEVEKKRTRTERGNEIAHAHGGRVLPHHVA